MVLEILDLKGQLAAYRFDSVNLGKDSLKLIERFQTFFNRQLLLFFFLISSHLAYKYIIGFFSNSE